MRQPSPRAPSAGTVAAHELLLGFLYVVLLPWWVNRRAFLTGAAIGPVSLLAGCGSTGTGNGTGDRGGSPEPLDGEWSLQARVRNEDDTPREWRVESRSKDRESVAAAWGTVPAGQNHELGLSGRLFDEHREVVVESDGGEVSERWRPPECRRLFAAVSIVDGNPRLETECRE